MVHSFAIRSAPPIVVQPAVLSTGLRIVVFAFATILNLLSTYKTTNAVKVVVRLVGRMSRQKFEKKNDKTRVAHFQLDSVALIE